MALKMEVYIISDCREEARSPNKRDSGSGPKVRPAQSKKNKKKETGGQDGSFERRRGACRVRISCFVYRK